MKIYKLQPKLSARKKLKFDFETRKAKRVKNAPQLAKKKKVAKNIERRKRDERIAKKKIEQQCTNDEKVAKKIEKRSETKSLGGSAGNSLYLFPSN